MHEMNHTPEFIAWQQSRLPTLLSELDMALRNLRAALMDGAEITEGYCASRWQDCRLSEALLKEEVEKKGIGK